MRLLPLPEVVYTQGKGKAEIDPDMYAEQVCQIANFCVNIRRVGCSSLPFLC